VAIPCNLAWCFQNSLTHPWQREAALVGGRTGWKPVPTMWLPFRLPRTGSLRESSPDESGGKAGRPLAAAIRPSRPPLFHNPVLSGWAVIRPEPSVNAWLATYPVLIATPDDGGRSTVQYQREWNRNSAHCISFGLHVPPPLMTK